MTTKLRPTRSVTCTYDRVQLRRGGPVMTVTMRFTFAGPHPLKSTTGVNCIGSARSEGQLTYNITSDPAHERPGWAIRLKAFEGITFESCPAIGYATWTLTRHQPFAH